MTEYYVVGTDGAQTDAFSTLAAAQAAMTEPGDRIESFPVASDSRHYCAGTYNDSRFGC
jgi:hypothetical protein